jgi:hypothetical protein
MQYPWVKEQPLPNKLESYTKRGFKGIQIVTPMLFVEVFF